MRSVKGTACKDRAQRDACNILLTGLCVNYNRTRLSPAPPLIASVNDLTSKPLFLIEEQFLTVQVSPLGANNDSPVSDDIAATNSIKVTTSNDRSMGRLHLGK